MTRHITPILTVEQRCVFSTGLHLIETAGKSYAADYPDDKERALKLVQEALELNSYLCSRPVVEETERILCAAIFVETGESEPPRRSYTYPATGLLFCGWRHADCFTSLNAWADLLPIEQRQKIGEEQLAGRNQGFLTSMGRFVSREDAMLIARQAGQTSSAKDTLFSEDLY